MVCSFDYFLWWGVGKNILTKVLATDSGKETAVNENAATIAPVAPKDSNIRRKKESNRNISLCSI